MNQVSRQINYMNKQVKIFIISIMLKNYDHFDKSGSKLDKQQPFPMRRSSRLLTGTLVSWTGRITLVTCGTAVQLVPTRDGVWCETTSLSCYGIPFVTARAVIWTYCHHVTRLVLALNWIFSLWPLEEREIPAKKLVSPLAIMRRTAVQQQQLTLRRRFIVTRPNDAGWVRLWERL